MTEITLAVFDEQQSTLLIDTTHSAVGAAVHADLGNLLGQSEPVACAKPRRIIRPDARMQPRRSDVAAIISGYWHGSVIEGPGVRSVVRFQGCPIRCNGCYVPETWEQRAGVRVSVGRLAVALLDPAHQRDGVTILGGEPFAQPRALASLVATLRQRQSRLHILVYTGYTLERLRQRDTGQESTEFVLNNIDMLVDGPYIAALADGAGPWTGSGNQRVINMKEWRRDHC